MGKTFLYIIFFLNYHLLQDLSLKGFWLQKWLGSDKAVECRNMIDYLLGLTREGKLKYEYVVPDLLIDFTEAFVSIRSFLYLAIT